MMRFPKTSLAACTLAALAGSAFVPAPAAQAQMLEPEDTGFVWEVGGTARAENPPLIFDVLPHDVGGVGCGKACRAVHMAELGWQPGMLVPGMRSANGGVRGPGPTDPTDLLHNNLSVEVNPPTRFITGTNVMTVKSNVNGLASFVFRLRSSFTITACEVTDSVGTYNVSPVMAATGYGRTVTLVRTINAGQTFQLRVSYNGAPPNLAFGNFYAGGQQGMAANPGAIMTLSEPYYSATWWPCKDGDVLTSGDNIDKATLTFSITAPDTFKSTANGMLTGISVPAAGKRTYTYATSYPIATYLVAFATTVYNSWTTTYTYPGGTMPLEFNIYPATDTPARRTAWGQVANIMAILRPIYGEYPFVNEKYGIYQFEFGGGMEHQTNTGQGGNGAWNESLSAHELGHQWWGNNVTCRTWADIWLNEGFATYTEAIYAERKAAAASPGDPGAGLTALKSAMASRRPSNLALSVYCTDTTDVNRIFSSSASYNKGAWSLHQLRHIVGDTTFTSILMAYRAAFEGSAATTADFTTLASAVAGQNLDWYFNPWIFGIGAPAYEFGWQPAVINGQNYLRLMLRQTQQGPNPTYPLFTMPIDVRITTASGTVNTVVRHDAATDHYLIPLAAAPTAVAIDPDDWIFNTGKSSTPYVAGPPKIIAASPLPGSTTPAASSPSALRIGFSENVSLNASSFAVARVTGSGSVSVPFTLAFNAPTLEATLTFSAPLEPGTYNIAVADTVAALAGGLTLDGEIAANSAAAFPSGDGQPGGAAAYTFTISAPLTPDCLADFDNSGQASIDDLFLFLNAWFSGDAAADVNDQGGVSIDDLFVFLNAWFRGC